MAAALGPALLAAGCTSTSPGPSAEIDVAIVGGGPSGLYAAHRDAPP
jgi:ribulose 1,5-bisphosphate synthetase/thiazole synthase